ncbi:hypothetical protein V1478_007514 [Vespula squamosa]|uniref:Uncharacterized protein n=1 Tax=Vespula squamosa TaxID=30214 RepID=A0ABD2B3J7_VESSQ
MYDLQRQPPPSHVAMHSSDYATSPEANSTLRSESCLGKGKCISQGSIERIEDEDATVLLRE